MGRSQTPVFLGHPLDNPSEQRFLTRLLRDLATRGEDALVLANFLVGRDQRQIDFLIVREDHVVHCEVKALTSPAIGGPNGRWRKVMPDGTRRRTPDNPFRQAHTATMALSDELRAFAAEADVPSPPDGKYYLGIDTILCVFPSIPEGSEISDHQHVAARSYEATLETALAPGRHLAWTRDDWLALIDRVGLVDQEAFTEDAKQRAQQTGLLADYRRQFVTRYGTDLRPRVQTPTQLNGVDNQDIDLASRLADGQCGLITGPSGMGKTLWAAHCALKVSSDGELPVWLYADAFNGTLESALDEAVAPFAPSSWAALTEAAAATGSAVLLVVDGLNETPEHLLTRLLDELGALRNASGIGVLMTAQRAPSLPESLDGEVVELAELATADRQAVLNALRHPELLEDTQFLRTPQELALAAACAAEAPELDSGSQLVDAYIRRLVAREPVRRALRGLAVAMFERYRGSLSNAESQQVLARTADIDAAAGDAALESRLIEIRPGRVAFVHERFLTFLAAESKVLAAADGDALAAVLSHPREQVLTNDALARETDPDRLRAALQCTDRDEVLAAALAGQLGGIARQAADSLAHELLTSALRATVSDPPTLEREGGPFGFGWNSTMTWSGPQLALLRAIGITLRDGRHIHQVIELIGACDELVARISQGESSPGQPRPLDGAIAATYAFGLLGDGSDGLPVTAIFQGLTQHRLALSRLRLEPGLVAVVGRSPKAAGWGSYFLAATLLERYDHDEADYVPLVLEAGWHAGGYHLRLAVLHMVQTNAWRLSEVQRDRVGQFLQGIEPGNIGVSTTLVEAMASLDLIEPDRTTQDVEREIDLILSTPGSEDARSMARGAVSSQFEEERIVGPYYRTITDLAPSKRIPLLVMAAQASRPDDLTTGWILDELEASEQPLSESGCGVLSGFAQPGDTSDWIAPQWGAYVTLSAVRQSAGFLEQPPFDVTEQSSGWEVVCALVFWAHRPDEESSRAEEERLWALLENQLRPSAAATLCVMSDARTSGNAPDQHALLIKRHRERILDLARWSLEHRDELVRPRAAVLGRVKDYLLGVIGAHGDERDVALLRTLADDPQTGAAAVDALRTIAERD